MKKTFIGREKTMILAICGIPKEYHKDISNVKLNHKGELIAKMSVENPMISGWIGTTNKIENINEK